jgi:hypothetical protein
VRHRLDAQRVLDPLRDLDRAVAGRAGGAVGHGDVGGLVLPQLVQRLLELLHALVGLRREELEREDGTAVFEDLIDAHSASTPG